MKAMVDYSNNVTKKNNHLSCRLIEHKKTSLLNIELKYFMLYLSLKATE